MAKGRSGLPIDSSDLITTRFFLHNPTVLNSFPEQPQNNTQNIINFNINKKQQHIFNMDSTETTKTGRPSSSCSPSSSSPPTTIQFPVNLINSLTDHEEYEVKEDASLPSDHDHHHHHHHHHHRRAIIDEMDFFSDKNHVVKPTNTDHDDLKEDPRTPPGLEFNVNTGLNLLTTNTSSDQSMVDDGMSANMEDKRAKSAELAVLQADIERMKMENLRLMDMLNQVTTNYNKLQVHLVTLIQGQKGPGNNNEQDNLVDIERLDQEKKVLSRNGTFPRQFMELGLAAGGSGSSDNDELSLISEEGRNGGDRSRSPGNNNNNNNNMENRNNSGNNEQEEEEEEDPDQGSQVWGPNKVSRFNSSKDIDQTEATIRKARVSVRARSEAPMITDGCQWRKYGQKMAKGNPCPRAYYRCTMAAGCPVRKQVQRCAEDRTVLITTYEGNHNHPLPPAAMAMASTTSSAARMLLSGSMPSADGMINSTNFLTRTLLPCSSSMATISASAPFPTVTLDLTQNPNPLQFQRAQPTHIQVPFPNPPQNFANTPTTGLLPKIFGQALCNQSKFSGLQTSQDLDPSQLGRQGLHNGQQNALADTVTAATAAIAADPNFTAAIAAAITSIIGGAHPNNVANANNNPLPTSTSNGNITASNSNSNNKITSSSFPGN